MFDDDDDDVITFLPRRYVNKQLENLINDFRQEHDKLHSKQEQYKAEGGRVTELTRDLANLSDELGTVAVAGLVQCCSMASSAATPDNLRTEPANRTVVLERRNILRTKFLLSVSVSLSKI